MTLNKAGTVLVEAVTKSITTMLDEYEKKWVVGWLIFLDDAIFFGQFGSVPFDSLTPVNQVFFNCGI